jgi:hypothetical protein
VHDSRNTAGPGQFERRIPPLNAAVHLWPTATAGDAKASGSRNLEGSKAHAGVSLTDAILHDFCEDVLGVARCYDIEQALDSRTIRFGGFVGAATLVGVVPPRSALLPIASQYPPAVHAADAWRWHMAEQFGFLLEDVRPLTKFVPYPGALGFFRVPPAVVSTLVEAEAQGPRP